MYVLKANGISQVFHMMCNQALLRVFVFTSLSGNAKFDFIIYAVFWYVIVQNDLNVVGAYLSKKAF